MKTKIPWQLSIAMGRIRLSRTFAVPPMFEKHLRFIPFALRTFSCAVMLRLHLLTQLSPFSQTAPVLKFIFPLCHRALSR